MFIKTVIINVNYTDVITNKNTKFHLNTLTIRCHVELKICLNIDVIVQLLNIIENTDVIH